MENNFDSLKKKPVAMMTGEELATLVADVVAPTDGDATTATHLVTSLPKYVYGITQIGRKIIVDAEKALVLAAGSKCNDSN